MKIKIGLLFTVFYLSILSVRANLVAALDARNVALNFFKAVANSTGSATTVTATLKYTGSGNNGVISLYVFDMSPTKGFVIVSASDYDGPVIGYSTESFFNPNFSKIGLNDWLNRWSEEIAFVEKNRILASAQSPALWLAYRQGIVPGSSRAAGVAPLCTTAWDQSNETGLIPALYNEDCPYDADSLKNALTGCVATAMAQIMKYWNYPSHGTGVAIYNDDIYDGFSYNYGIQTFNFNNTSFNWGNMPSSLSVSSTASQDSAVSLLNYACGVSVHMDYGTAESGSWVLAAQSTNGASAEQAFKQYFKYNALTILGVPFSGYTTSNWIALIENELNNGRPVLYQGYEVTAGAHAWVCDGYNSSDLMHMNWGWGGQNDGWYAVTNLTPSTHDFTYNIAALIGIKPGIEAVANPPVICSGGSSHLTVNGGPPLGASYSWAPSTGLSCTLCGGPQATPTSTTTYTVTIDSGETTIISSVTVYVDQPHNLNYTLSDSQLCVGNSATLSLVGVSGISINPATSVTWNDSLSATLHPDSTTTYLITTQSSVCATSDSANITVHVTLYQPVTLDLSSTVLCLGSYATLTYSGLSGVAVQPSGYSYSAGDNILVLDPDTTTGFTVSGATSCGSLYTDTFTLSVTPNNGALAYTLSDSTLCGGDTAVLSIRNATDIQILPSVPVTSLGNSAYLLTPVSSTTFYVTGYSAACGGPASVNIPVKVIPTGSLNYALSNQDVCSASYEYIYLYGVTGNIESNPSLYFYFSDSTDAYAYFVADSTTTYTISATTICGKTGTANVQVKVLPSVSYNLQQGTVCQGDSTLFTVLGLTGLNIYPASGFRMIDSSNYEFYPSATTNYELDGYDCTGTYNYHSFTINVAQPGVFNYSLQDSDVCSVSGTEVFLNGVVNPQINPAATLFMTDQVDYYSYLYPQTTTTYTVSGQGICGSPVSTSFNVYVFPKSGYVLGAHNVCPGGSTTLTIKNLAEASIYPANYTAWLNDSVIRLSPVSEIEYELSGTDCSGNAQVYNIVVSVLPDTGVTFTVDSELCNGNEAYLTVSGASNIVVTPPVNLTYTDSFDAYAYIQPSVSTTYTVSGNSQCTNTTDVDVFKVYLVEDPSYSLSPQNICNNDSTVIETFGLDNWQISPNVDVTYFNSTSAYIYPATTTTYTLSGSSFCTNAPYSQSFTITVDSISRQITLSHDTLFAASASNYQWMLNGITIQGENRSFIVPTSKGTYSVELGGANGCSATSSSFDYTGIDEIVAKQDYVVYPNPSNGAWIIQSTNDVIGNNCEIFDGKGRLVYDAVITGSKYEIDTDLSPGIYLLKILVSGQTIFIAKLAKL